MKSEFCYHRPQNPLAAQELKKLLGPQSVYWAGGTDLILQWQRGVKKVEHCIDLTHTGMDVLFVEGEEIHIGSTVKLSTLESAANLHPQMAILEKTARMMATPQVRTIATIGGNICNAVPSADMAPSLMALDASVVTTAGKYSIEEFFTGVRQTVLKEEELVVEFVIPVKTGFAADYQRITRGSVDISLTGAATSLSVDDSGIIRDCRISLNAVAPTPVRARKSEKMLINKSISRLSESDLMEVAKQALQSIKPIDDIRGSITFRNYAATVTVKRSLETVVNALK